MRELGRNTGEMNQPDVESCPQTRRTITATGTRWRLPTRIRSRAADVTTQGRRTARTWRVAHLWRQPGPAAARARRRQPEALAPSRITLPRRRTFISPDQSMVQEADFG